MNYNALNASVGPEEGHNTSSSANPLNYVDSANARGYINELSAGARSDEPCHSTPSSTEVNNDILRENVSPGEVRITSSSANPQNYIDSTNDRTINNELLEYDGTNEDEINHDRIRALYLRTYFNRPRSRFITRDISVDINTNLQNEFIDYGTLTRY